jgi:hypothetical protein
MRCGLEGGFAGWVVWSSFQWFSWLIGWFPWAVAGWLAVMSSHLLPPACLHSTSPSLSPADAALRKETSLISLPCL